MGTQACNGHYSLISILLPPQMSMRHFWLLEIKLVVSLCTGMYAVPADLSPACHVIVTPPDFSATQKEVLECAMLRILSSLIDG